ncbi:hypothetical protein CLIB1444_03S08328 [[Candida] jaroonii]|uniref:Uncharacterized protein n=1 Tax=[Candida] jaroonii TaxID=467808 RepID=A0ACA9Y783_9ASCO|nr:hypothetical protein CLIB1444_03S08328 [[Candida] jaroonii]
MPYIKTLKGKIIDSTVKGIPLGDVTIHKFNKIGGHTIIYKFGKYLIKRNQENKIYDLIDSEYSQLKPFVPQYFGLIQMIVPEADSETMSDKEITPQEHREINDDDESLEYLVMEDLTNFYQKPFIIDLKMGTRQYGINSSSEKIKRQQIKCKKSTSRQLGVRLCGLQLWQNNSQVILDKYYGRKLNEQQFLNDLFKFLDPQDSVQQISHKIKVIVKELEKLYEVMENLENYRLYGCSILIIYEGGLIKEHENGQVNGNGNDFDDEKFKKQKQTVNIDDDNDPFKITIKLIDFSKTLLNYTSKSSKDYGFLKGLVNVIGMFRSIGEQLDQGIDVNFQYKPLIYEFDDWVSE